MFFKAAAAGDIDPIACFRNAINRPLERVDFMPFSKVGFNGRLIRSIR
jgi:hypothetical protein